MKKLVKKYKLLNNEFKASIWYTISNVLQKSAPWLIMIILTHMVSSAEYGMYSIYMSWVEIVEIVVTLRIYSNGFVAGLVRNNERKDDGIEEEKGSLSYSENESLAENNVSSITENTSNDNVVYISKSGTKYHKIKQCTKANYSPIMLSEALQKGYTACLRCYKQ